MAEYIDKQELLSLLEKKIKEDNERRMAVVDRDFIDLINDATVISDMVEVVRCKDCIFYQANSCFNRQWDLESSTEVPMVRDCDFCSYGERRS